MDELLVSPDCDPFADKSAVRIIALQHHYRAAVDTKILHHDAIIRAESPHQKGKPIPA